MYEFGWNLVIFYIFRKILMVIKVFNRFLWLYFIFIFKLVRKESMFEVLWRVKNIILRSEIIKNYFIVVNGIFLIELGDFFIW